MGKTALNEHACAVLSLATRLAWSPELPPPLSRAAVRRMLDTGALKGLVLCETAGTEAKTLERARTLLTRVSAVHEAISAYEREGYTLLFPGDIRWPQSLGALVAQIPLFLFAKGNPDVLRGRRIAVAGSRRILVQTREAAMRTGRMIAQEGMVLVTGGAQGVDAAALAGALEAGGSAVLVPAVPAMQLLRSRELSEAVAAGRLLVLCDTLPDEPFSAAKALARNHTIYTLGETALVVAAREGRGGSWSGAADFLHGGWSPVRVWDGENTDTVGSRALIPLGAQAYTLERPLAQQIYAQGQTSLFDMQREETAWL